MTGPGAARPLLVLAVVVCAGLVERGWACKKTEDSCHLAGNDRYPMAGTNEQLTEGCVLSSIWTGPRVSVGETPDQTRGVLYYHQFGSGPSARDQFYCCRLQPTPECSVLKSDVTRRSILKPQLHRSQSIEPMGLHVTRDVLEECYRGMKALDGPALASAFWFGVDGLYRGADPTGHQAHADLLERVCMIVYNLFRESEEYDDYRHLEHFMCQPENLNAALVPHLPDTLTIRDCQLARFVLKSMGVALDVSQEQRAQRRRVLQIVGRLALLGSKLGYATPQTSVVSAGIGAFLEMVDSGLSHLTEQESFRFGVVRVLKDLVEGVLALNNPERCPSEATSLAGLASASSASASSAIGVVGTAGGTGVTGSPPALASGWAPAPASVQAAGSGVAAPVPDLVVWMLFKALLEYNPTKVLVKGCVPLPMWFSKLQQSFRFKAFLDLLATFNKEVARAVKQFADSKLAAKSLDGVVERPVNSLTSSAPGITANMYKELHKL